MVNIVTFLYMDGCGHCDQIKPTIEQLKKSIDTTKVNIESLNQNARGFNDKGEPVFPDVQGFPTIIKRTPEMVEESNYNGNMYSGDRSLEDLKSWSEAPYEKSRTNAGSSKKKGGRKRSSSRKYGYKAKRTSRSMKGKRKTQKKRKMKRKNNVYKRTGSIRSFISPIF